MDPCHGCHIMAHWHESPRKVPTYTAWWTEAHWCEQPAQGRCPTMQRPGVEPETSRSRVQHASHYTSTPPSHYGRKSPSKVLNCYKNRDWLFDWLISQLIGTLAFDGWALTFGKLLQMGSRTKSQSTPHTRRKRYSKNVNQFVSIFSATDSVRRSNSLGWLPLSIARSISSANNVFSTLQQIPITLLLL